MERKRIDGLALSRGDAEHDEATERREGGDAFLKDRPAHRLEHQGGSIPGRDVPHERRQALGAIVDSMLDAEVAQHRQLVR